MERKEGTEVILLYLSLQVEIDSTYRILLFFFLSQRLMIRNFAMSIGLFISKHYQMPHLSHLRSIAHASCVLRRHT